VSRRVITGGEKNGSQIDLSHKNGGGGGRVKKRCEKNLFRTREYETVGGWGGGGWGGTTKQSIRKSDFLRPDLLYHLQDEEVSGPRALNNASIYL